MVKDGLSDSVINVRRSESGPVTVSLGCPGTVSRLPVTVDVLNVVRSVGAGPVKVSLGRPVRVVVF